MFLRSKNRFKDGKGHRCWSIVRTGKLKLAELFKGKFCVLERSMIVKEHPGAKPLKYFKMGRDGPSR